MYVRAELTSVILCNQNIFETNVILTIVWLTTYASTAKDKHSPNIISRVVRHAQLSLYTKLFN